MKLLLLLAGLSSMTAALDRGDLDEAARQGALAGPVVVEKAIAAASRTTRLAGIVAAPAVEDRVELLPALAHAASSADRRTAIPAARAAETIARELAQHELPDDLAPDDVATWRAAFEAIAHSEHCIEVRTLALDTATALAHAIDASDVGFDLALTLRDPDPAIRELAVALVPQPAPEATHGPLATAIADDADPKVALGAAQALCPFGLDARALDRIRALVAKDRSPAARDAARCLKP